MYAEPIHASWSMVIAPLTIILFVITGLIFFYLRYNLTKQDKKYLHTTFAIFGSLFFVLSFSLSYIIVADNVIDAETEKFEEIYNVDIVVSETRGGVVGDIPHYDSPEAKIIDLYSTDTGLVQNCYVSLDENYLYNVVCDGEEITVE